MTSKHALVFRNVGTGRMRNKRALIAEAFKDEPICLAIHGAREEINERVDLTPAQTRKLGLWLIEASFFKVTS